MLYKILYTIVKILCLQNRKDHKARTVHQCSALLYLTVLDIVNNQDNNLKVLDKGGTRNGVLSQAMDKYFVWVSIR